MSEVPDNEVQEIVDAFADALVTLEAARGGFIGERSFESMGEYLAALDRAVECHDAIEGVLKVVQFSEKLGEFGQVFADQAHRQAYDGLFQKTGEDT